MMASLRSFAVVPLLLSQFTGTYAGIFRRQTLTIPTDLPSNWSYVGCYSDSTDTRTLAGATYNGDAVTNEACISFCISNGYVVAGTEYAGQCYCDAIVGESGTVEDDSDCNMACTGDATEPCGGSNRLSIFKGPLIDTSTPPATIAGWSYTGCYTDSVGARTLATPVYPAGSMTNELCTSTCAAAGYQIAGTEYGGECYCANAYTNGGGPASNGEAGCSVACNGDSTEICGGSNRLSVYTQDGSGTTPTSSSTSSAPTTSSTGSAAVLPAGWSYVGCYLDGITGRDLIYQQSDSDTNTIEQCITTCAGLGYVAAGVEYGVECYCDNFLRNGATLATSDSDCSMACAGDSSEKCGAGNRLSIYSNTTLQVYQPPQVQNTSLPGSWTYQGCLLDDAVDRTFFYQLILSDNNTAENCLTQCSTFGYNAGGMEYGDECYCGDVQNIIDLGRTLQPESDCNSVCSGNGSYICGGGNRISYYSWEGDPLYTWTFAQGNDAGIYEFLMSSPIIPLISSVATNSKIVFLEKFGTSPENNSSGTYEFDPYYAGDYTNAFRELHVKTDVFCGASLVLPDKVGRQINIGGWANDATYGIRLYWPDGSPGVPGTNDWEENYEELSLQQGRWYPSAMTLSNGSILIVGGEVGSNGAPVPTLEVLPRPEGAGVVQCDYLARTDPYSTYPFLAVLPSGGIFIGYYNEARILDPVTFLTIKTLPNMPGQVNDFLAGRTYPFEGTMMLMPQYAPYSDPLTVLVCGGSNPGPEYGTDNCISIQPDAANPTWTIERMPSTRVIVCMVALPDGTYLILNGGENGVAGFGLGRDPNHNAVLYNPSSPVGSRMTSMANTTIDRLYHSEAVLMMDGSILVSGSDPEDNGIHPQEHRLEYFYPPYILSGAARPAFTITNTDWAYGETVSFTLTASTSTNIKVSLIAAVGSTHGNSMGQRTLFPAMSCSGNTCQVTAPPDAKVSPPAWYQMFVLDGPTPSHATWVRIGGDPASLGNWPDFPDFTTPGV